VAIDDDLVDDPAGAPGVPRSDDRGREVEHDGDARHACAGRPLEERPSRRSLDIRRVDNDQPAGGQPLLQLAMEDRERQPRRSLVRGVTGDRLAIRVGREDLGRGEESRSERRLAGAGGPDEDDERGIGDP